MAEATQPKSPAQLRAQSRDSRAVRGREPLRSDPTLQALYDAFADGWEVESLELVGGEVNPAFEAELPGKLANMKMWFAVIRRKP